MLNVKASRHLQPGEGLRILLCDFENIADGSFAALLRSTAYLDPWHGVAGDLAAERGVEARPPHHHRLRHLHLGLAREVLRKYYLLLRNNMSVNDVRFRENKSKRMDGRCQQVDLAAVPVLYCTVLYCNA